jgi:hypothetical protein
MRTVTFALGSILAISLCDVQAFAASNPDRTYYRGAGSCGGAAYCSYRANKKAKRKARSSEELTLGYIFTV